MATVFVSYRRSDSQDVTGRIYDRLVGKYAQKQIFKDVDSIPLGVSFPAHIRQLLSKANVVLVVIGPTWTTALDEHGRRRLDDPNDFVRLEVELALRAEMPVIPVLVSNARMPLAKELPASLRALASRNGIAVRPDPDFNNDITRLFAGLDHLEKLLKPRSARPAKPGSDEIIDAELANTEIIDALLVSLPRPRAKAHAKAKPRAQAPDRPRPEARRPRRGSPWFLLLALLVLVALSAMAVYFYWHLLADPAPAPRPVPGNFDKDKNLDKGKADDKFDFKDKDVGKDKAGAGNLNLNGTAWLGMYLTSPRTFIFEADGTVSYLSAKSSKAGKNGGSWKLDGNQLYYEHSILSKKGGGGPLKVMEFRGTVIDANTIVGEAIYLADGTKAQQTLQRTTWDGGKEKAPLVDLDGSAWLGLPGVAILESGGTVSYASSESNIDSKFRNQGTWKLDGNQLYFVNAMVGTKGIEFRGTVMDANTIVGEATFLSDGSKGPWTLTRMAGSGVKFDKK